jgi:3,4-dihydroxy 2-butanone 4-phosphate synthase/GTP cyclohydrolase II
MHKLSSTHSRQPAQHRSGHDRALSGTHHVSAHALDLAAISSIHEVLADIKAGKMVIIVDDEDRENEGDLVIVAVD